MTLAIIVIIILLILIWIRIPHRGPRKVPLQELLFWLAMGGLAMALWGTPPPPAPPPFQWPAPGAFVQPQHVPPQRPLIQTPPGVEPDPLANPALHLTPL